MVDWLLIEEHTECTSVRGRGTHQLAAAQRLPTSNLGVIAIEACLCTAVNEDVFGQGMLAVRYINQPYVVRGISRRRS